MAAFVKVVEANGFSAAAPQLGLTPSAVSKLVTRLEERLGVRLFNRTTRKLALTEAGENFYRDAARIIGEVDEVEAAIGRRGHEARGLVKVTTSLAFGAHQILPLVPEFLDNHPGIELDLSFTDRVVDLVQEGFDVAFRIGHLADSSFVARKIGEDRRVVVAAPSYLRKHGEPKHPDELVRHNCLGFRDRTSMNRWPFLVDGATREVMVRGNCRGDDGDMLYQLAVEGVGIVRLTRLTVARAVRAGGLVEILQPFTPRDTIPIQAVYPHRRLLPPKVTALVDFLTTKFDPPPWEDESSPSLSPQAGRGSG
ncbi:MAG: LysR family transcriptional regulator [Alphaproteobacteria bacterium]|nr:LysR family transcriptional regulator [Alphaproteobacteria bacterium]